MFSKGFDHVDVYKVGKRQLEGWIESGALDNPVYAAYPVNNGDYVIVQLTSVFGSMRTTPMVWTGFFNELDAVSKLPANVEFRNPDKPWCIGYAAEIEVWQVVDDAKLWYDWDFRVRRAKLRDGVPFCAACKDEYGPWVRVPTPGGYGCWRYLCEDCYDRFNLVNGIVGRMRLECY